MSRAAFPEVNYQVFSLFSFLNTERLLLLPEAFMEIIGKTEQGFLKVTEKCVFQSI